MKRVLIAGKDMQIVQTSKQTYIDKKEGILYLGQDLDETKKVLKEAAIPYIEEKVFAMAARLNQPVPVLRYGFYKSKWGSYSRSKHQMAFNLSMVFFEPDLLEHVVAHEFAHTYVYDHSPMFYAMLSHIEPAYKERQKRLKEIKIEASSVNVGD
jgi:predicted metal-dependent hydrolase